VLVYFNLDTAVTSNNPQLASRASGSLIDLLTIDVFPTILHPISKIPLDQAWGTFVSTPGSGSDYVVFIDHLGIPSFDSTLIPIDGPSRGNGGYHSKFDDLTRLETFVDPGYVWHKLISEIYASMLWKCSTDLIVPFTYGSYAARLKLYTDTIAIAVAEKVSMTSLYSAVDNFRDAAQSIANEINNLGTNTNEAEINDLNRRLSYTERQFLTDGLPQRRWFKSPIQAPGLTKGYDFVAFPGITDAIELEKWDEAILQTTLLSNRINSAATFLRGSEKPSEALSPLSIALISIAVVFMILFLAFIAIWAYRRYINNQQYTKLNDQNKIV